MKKMVCVYTIALQVKKRNMFRLRKMLEVVQTHAVCVKYSDSTHTGQNG